MWVTLSGIKLSLTQYMISLNLLSMRKPRRKDKKPSLLLFPESKPRTFQCLEVGEDCYLYYKCIADNMLVRKFL